MPLLIADESEVRGACCVKTVIVTVKLTGIEPMPPVSLRWRECLLHCRRECYGHFEQIAVNDYIKAAVHKLRKA